MTRLQGSDLTRFLRALVAIPRAMGQGLEPRPILEAALDGLVAAAGLSGAAVQLLDQAEGRLYHVLGRGVDGPALASLGHRRLGEGLCGRVVQTGRALFLENLSAGEAELAGLISRGLRRLALIPVPSAAGTMGLALAVSPGEGWPDEIRAFLEAVAAQLGVALENLGLLDEVMAAGQEWEATFDALEDLILVCDAEGRVSRANLALAARLGQPREDLVGRACHDLAGGDLCGCAGGVCLVGQALAAGATRSVEVDSAALGGRFQVAASPLGSGTVLLAHDLGLVQELAATRAEATRLAEVDRFKSAFVAQVSHEFKTPLHGILNTAEMLAEGLYDDLTTEQRGAVTDILTSGRRLQSLVTDLLDLTKLEAGRLDLDLLPLNLSLAVARAAAGLAERARIKRVELAAAGAGQAPVVLADPNRLSQALTSLMSWAVERTPAGGRVSWTVSSGEDGQARLTILDQGQPPRGEDPSLALTLARRLVEIQGGRLILGPDPEAPGGAVTMSLPQED